MAERTVWDRDWNGIGTETTWDRDWNGPGTETFWDLIPAVLGAVYHVVLLADRWRATLLADRWRVKT